MKNKIYKLAFDNYTPLTRTPWAGEGVFRKLKKNLEEKNGRSKAKKIGECWEVSCDTHFPSMVAGRCPYISLHSLISSDPHFFLGKAHGVGTSEILLKTLHAAVPLSLQVHPSDSYPELAGGEYGKPESWYVLDAEKGAGLYLGLKIGVSEQVFRDCLTSGGSLEKLLHFVPVKKGDYFEIAPGMLHAVGPGVLLAEPQIMRLGKSGKTYRVWDWNRKYSPDGTIDKMGSPRELHIDHAMACIDFNISTKTENITDLKLKPQLNKVTENTTEKKFPANKHYQVKVIESKGPSSLKLSVPGRYGCGLVVRGKCKLEFQMFELGEPFFFSAGGGDIELFSSEGCEIFLVQSAI